jgi:hypothetical protein
MTCNVGGVDRAARIVVGLAAIGAGMFFKSWWGALGAVPLITGLVRWCPAYIPFGVSTGKPTAS